MNVEGKFITMLQYLKGGYKEDRDSIFARGHMENMRDNGLKLLLGIFYLNTSRNISQ